MSNPQMRERKKGRVDGAKDPKKNMNMTLDKLLPLLDVEIDIFDNEEDVAVNKVRNVKKAPSLFNSL